MTTLAPSLSKIRSSSLVSPFSNSNLYWNPEHPPPSTCKVNSYSSNFRDFEFKKKNLPKLSDIGLTLNLPLSKFVSVWHNCQTKSDPPSQVPVPSVKMLFELALELPVPRQIIFSTFLFQMSNYKIKFIYTFCIDYSIMRVTLILGQKNFWIPKIYDHYFHSC